MYNLGNVLISQGKYDEAYEVYVHVLELFQATVGEQHNKTASTYYKLAWHLHRVGEYEAARQV
jgi:tetratricopeptide (TPR) repeat protein